MATDMTPDEWQAYCQQLCRLRHGPANYQEVPDHDRGDLGIEGFALDGSATVYQFYVAEATDTAGRFAAQQAKMTRDLGKLKKNEAKLLGTVGFPIKRWILVVPTYDSKRIVEHATTKAQEVAAQGLTCVDGDHFRVLVQDESAFTLEREALIAAGVSTAKVPIANVEGELVENWAVENAIEVERLDEKLNRLLRDDVGAEQRLGRLRQELLTFHLTGENYTQQLADEYPELFERFTLAKTAEESDLALRSLTAPADPLNHLDAVRRQYETRLATRVPGLAPEDAPTLSWAGIAEWLIRCPLDFPAVTR